MNPGGGTGNRPGPAPVGPHRNLLARIFGILGFGLVVGIAGSLLGIAMVEAMVWLWQRLLAWSARQPPGPDLVLLLGPVIGGLAVGLLIRGMSQRRPDNVAHVIYAVQTRENRLPWRDGVINSLATIIGIGTGASVGQYGPLANMGAALGSNAARWLRYDATLGIGCGVAAVISTAFSAPIAAILFVHEVILRHYSLRAFAPITVASSTGFFIEYYLFGRPPLFEIGADRAPLAPEFFAFVIVGIAGALVAVVFMRAVLFSAECAERSGIPAWLRPAVAGLGVGLIAQWVPEALGLGMETLADSIAGEAPPPGQQVLALVAKIVATALCLGFGFAGGVFSPALLIGVLTGTLLGSIAGMLFGDVLSAPAVYAVCGMAAVASPVIGGPLTAILIVFELTRNYELTTAVMISVVFSNVVAYRLFGRSLFDRQLANEGADLSHGRDKLVLERMPIGDHMASDAVTLPAGAPLQAARDALIDARRQECYVLDEQGQFLGKIALSELLPLARNHDTDSEPVVNHVSRDFPTFTEDDSVWSAAEKTSGFVGESIPVIGQDGRFLGIVYEATLLAAYLSALATVRAEQHAA